MGRVCLLSMFLEGGGEELQCLCSWCGGEYDFVRVRQAVQMIRSQRMENNSPSGKETSSSFPQDGEVCLSLYPFKK